jgi:hypothetical protein
MKCPCELSGVQSECAMCVEAHNINKLRSEMMIKVPYEDRKEVQDVLNNDILTNEEKANRIYLFDFDMACRMTDTISVKTSMSKNQIIKILDDRDMELFR